MTSKELEEAFNAKAQDLAIYTMQFDSMVESLSPNQIKRAFKAVMHYPTPLDNPGTDEDEINVAQLGVVISVTKAAMATINMAIEEQNREDV